MGKFVVGLSALALAVTPAVAQLNPAPEVKAFCNNYVAEEFARCRNRGDSYSTCDARRATDYRYCVLNYPDLAGV